MTTQIERIAKALVKNGTTARGVSATRLASLTKVPVGSVHKRIHDLRKRGYAITSTFDFVKGSRKVFYKAA